MAIVIVKSVGKKVSFGLFDFIARER